MLERNLLFECEHKNMLPDEVVLKDFWVDFDKEYEPKNDSLSELFLKVGSRFGPIDFSFDLYPSSEDNSKICRIDDVQFISNVLRTIKSYRLILEDGSGGDWGVYKKLGSKGILVNRLSKEKEYIIAFDGKPIVRITTKPKKDNQVGHVPIIFESYDKTALFTHEPDLDTNPNQVRIKLSVADQEKQKLFVSMYDFILRHYSTYGTKIEEPA